MSRNYRIKDIAEMAGVSTGTVDRILHNRGKVSEEARKKVEKVLEEINYQPNLIARSLALKKEYHFYTLIPSFNQGEYWETFCLGVKKAEQELLSYNVFVHNLFFDQYDKSSFDELVDQVAQAEDCQGVVIATLFMDSALHLAHLLDEQAVPYVLVDAYIDQTKCISYYGTHSHDSGYIAGRLLLGQIEEDDDIVIFRFIRKGDLYSTQVQKREKGFRDYLLENHYKGKIHPIAIHADDQENNTILLDQFFETHPQINAGIIFNSRAHLLGNYFSERQPEKQFKLIGYDVIDENVYYLNSGHITHLIAQRPEVQGVNCIKALFRYLVLEKLPPPINYMPIDILVKENIQYYNNYI
ncbi:LacI family DNA-binding transcriptional regulator [Parabacteroides sp. PF5-9]|uniref:LacI family DNA-binding transcriptional regulator n=1 Tax=Parabacteroides sp. PF5-9 TaxID=1742404 RepID=UPI0024765585|nr:LacI family DNA-binding transcriptional regulator [Parabacteroides sp. PF5-9]MDH6359058.1 LacI family transcriptional regulator [Parabacteroides sp. PF5-9]